MSAYSGLAVEATVKE